MSNSRRIAGSTGHAEECGARFLGRALPGIVLSGWVLFLASCTDSSSEKPNLPANLGPRAAAAAAAQKGMKGGGAPQGVKPATAGPNAGMPGAQRPGGVAPASLGVHATQQRPGGAGPQAAKAGGLATAGAEADAPLTKEALTKLVADATKRSEEMQSGLKIAQVRHKAAPAEKQTAAAGDLETAQKELTAAMSKLANLKLAGPRAASAIAKEFSNAAGRFDKALAAARGKL
ncbi:MAG: hypothetical protein JNJ88_08565 [Planctomycetes bacterium]|nr:hypothetical protein [Planctomycetota bacterium]